MADTEVRSQLQNAYDGSQAEAKEGWNHKPYGEHAAYKPAGRLGDASFELLHDPRTNSQLLEAAKGFGMDRNQPPSKLAQMRPDSTLEEISEMIAEFEDGIVALYGNIPLDLPEDRDAIPIEREDHTIKGGDGQDMAVYVYRPKDQKEALPSVVYTHGGGMTIAATLSRPHEYWSRSIAQQGVVVIMPDFRNAYTKQGFNHYPKGLNDCCAAIKWIAENKEKLKVRNIVLQGESGGGNLACATALKANREGWVKDIAGVYAVVPYISNGYGWSDERKLKETPSMVENHGYFLNAHPTAFMAYMYTPNDKDSVDPLAWPYHATLEDMKGLPPHILAMDELDFLRDEGVSYFRRLVQAGVPAKGHVNLGVTHGTSLIFRALVPDYHKQAVRDIASFAKSL